MATHRHYYLIGHYRHAPSVFIELNSDLDLQTFGKYLQQPFSKPTHQDEHFGI